MYGVNGKHRLTVAASAVLSGILSIGCGADTPGGVGPVSVSQQELRGEEGARREGAVVSEWMEHSLETVRVERIGTSGAGRLYAMAGIAMFDAVNGIEHGRGHRRGYDHALVSPAGAPPQGHPGAAAAAAAHAVLVGLRPTRAAALDAALATYVASLPGGARNGRVAAGLDWGEHVGQQVLAIRSTDGSQAADLLPARTGVGEFRASFDARWRNMAPFGVASIDPYLSPPPPPLGSSEYATDFNLTKTLGTQDGDAERNEISDFWFAPTGTVVETGTWVQATLAIVDQQRTTRDILETARVFALVTMGIGDAVIATVTSKARYFTWRPFHAIREADLDGNPNTAADPDWVSRTGSIGDSPEYTSGTSTFAGAASVALERVYGSRLNFCFETDGASNGPRCYSSPLEGAKEAGHSRIIQGIHFNFSNLEGHRVGRAIGTEIVNTRLLRCRGGCFSSHRP